MTIVPHDSVPSYDLPGLQHRTLAGRAVGLSALEIWRQTLAPGASTPPHYHDCEEVVVVQRGTGVAICGDKSHAFGAGSALIFPPREIHQLINSADDEMVLVAALSASPARVFSPSGEEISLPWQEPR